VIRRTPNPDKGGSERIPNASGRAPRVSAERLGELAGHLAERDREIALCLYEQQVLATDQLTLLFFSSQRRAQDRLLFLYRHRLLDRFNPAHLPRRHTRGLRNVRKSGASRPRTGDLLDAAWTCLAGSGRLAAASVL
jgi:hypothetical protein